jgi:hypothetical protein
MAARAKKLWKSRDESDKTKIYRRVRQVKIYRRDAEYAEKFEANSQISKSAIWNE